MPSTLRTHIKKEFLLIGLIFLFAYLCSVMFNLSESFFYFFSEYEKYNVDEVFIAINITGMVVFIYGLMRINFMSKEIKKRIEAEKTVDWISSHDVITSLPNQKFLDSFLSRHAENKQLANHAAFSIEINRFKDINDLLGYEHRNEIFKIVGQRISFIFPDNVFKLRGDEFLAFKSNKDKTDLFLLGERIVSSLCSPIPIEGFTFNIAANVGFSRFPEDSDDLRQVIQQSACALHMAKKAGREKVMGFIPAMQDNLLATALFRSDFKKALANKAFTVHYQPLVDLRTSKTVGFEALARWETGKAVGFVALQRIDPDNGAVEIGWINWSPLMKRTLCSTEAIYLLLDYVLGTLQYRRCAWKCDSLHEAAIKAAERLGFHYEGTLRQQQISKGHSRDTRWYSIIDSEWGVINHAMHLWLNSANFDDRGRQKQSLSAFMGLTSN